MVKWILTSLFFIPLLSLSQTTNNENVAHFLDAWHKAAAETKLEEYFNALDDDAVFIGTDSTEYWNKKEFYNFAKPYFEKGKAWNFRANSRHIYFSEDGNYAWFDELLFTGHTTWRGSGFIKKYPEGWKIKHYTLSVTLPNEKMNAFLKLLKEK